MLLLGIDVGTSSVKVSIVEVQSRQVVASATYPDTETGVITKQAGWAEQDPEKWWHDTQNAIWKCHALKTYHPKDIAAIGIAYQMHGLVVVDKKGIPLRPSIIWCDSRAVQYGENAFVNIGKENALAHLLNSPGNFTAAKLAWVKENEPALYEKIDKIMLPGDYIAMKFTGAINTTIGGLSEGIFWDFKEKTISKEVMQYFGFDGSLLPEIVPTFGTQGLVTENVAAELGFTAGIPVAYRAGDQPNNAASLNVFQPGEIASTAGTSGVVYGVSDTVNYDPHSRVNTFAHVNYTVHQPRLGILLCINGTGILNSWIKNNLMQTGITYQQMNELAAQSNIGAKGISIIPFGNGAERVMKNKNMACSFHGINFNTHNAADMIRAAQEGIVFSFQYGIEIMEQMGMKIRAIRAGNANMFLSPIFRNTLAAVSGVTIELYNTDGAAGAAKAAGIGVGVYASNNEAFASLEKIAIVEPNTQHGAAYSEAYQCWKSKVELHK